MKLQDQQRAHYTAQIRLKIKDQPQSSDPVTQDHINEVVSALALGCSLQRPRRFRGKYMTADDFRRIADNISLNEIAVAVNAKVVKEKKGEKIDNPTWYLLGVLARF